MEENSDQKIELKDRIVFFLKKNKFKLITLILFILIIIFFFMFIKIQNEKKGNLISEKYITAGLYLSSNENEKSKKLFEEIILSENKFYSILALNSILEKNLEKDENKIFEYFEIVEKSRINQEQKDLLMIKKALYLIKMNKSERGEVILEKLINKESNFKNLAEEILNK